MSNIKKNVIYTDRLCLHSIDDNDLENMISILTNKEVSKTYMLPNFKNNQEVIKLFERLKVISNNLDRFVYGIYLKDTLIGFLNDVEIDNNKIEIGYVIDPKYKNNGYATEVLTVVIKELFEIGYTEVITGAFEENTASIRVMEKSGMTRLSNTDKIEYNGMVHNCVYFNKVKV